MNEDSLQVLTEFCEHHPEMLKRIHYRKLAAYDEPIPILDPVALETFRVWELQREYIKAQSTLLGRMTWLLRRLWMMRPLGHINLFPDVVFPQFRRRL
jgi:hypothetical protein